MRSLSLRSLAPLAALLLGAAVLATTAVADEPAPAEAAAEAAAEEAATAVAEEHAESDHGDAPALREPFPFDHAHHARAFKRADVTCVDCHPVGAFLAPDGPAPNPRASCHACHRGEVEGAPRKAPSACLGCHAERPALMPADHGMSWVDEHGTEARARNAECTDCHDTSTCVTCHEGRGALRKNPHGPGWGAFHGVEARVDPRYCSTCHIGEACATCHVEGVLPW